MQLRLTMTNDEKGQTISHQKGLLLRPVPVYVSICKLQKKAVFKNAQKLVHFPKRGAFKGFTKSVNGCRKHCCKGCRRKYGKKCKMHVHFQTFCSKCQPTSRSIFKKLNTLNVVAVTFQVEWHIFLAGKQESRYQKISWRKKGILLGNFQVFVTIGQKLAQIDKNQTNLIIYSGILSHFA